MAFTYDINNSKKDKVSSVCLLTTHTISEILNLFLSTFLVGYVYSLSSSVSNYIFNVGIYYVSMYAVSVLTHLILAPIVERTNRVWLYRLALLLRAGLVVVCIFCGQNIASLLVLAGALSGMSEAVYYSCYNTMKQEMVSRHSVKKYIVLSMVLKKFIYIVVPLALGALLDVSTYSNVAIYVLVIAVIQIGFSFGIHAKRPEGSSFSMKGYFRKLKERPELAKKMTLLYIGAIPYGLSTVVGVVLNISIMMKFESNFSLGWLTSVFSVTSALFLIVINKFTHAGKRTWLLVITGILPILASVLFVIFPGYVTIIFYNIANAISNITYHNIYDIYRNGNLKEAGLYSEIQEHQTLSEIIFNTMRVVSFGILLLLGLTNNIIVFNVFLCLCSCFYTATLVILIIYEKNFSNKSTKNKLQQNDITENLRSEKHDENVPQQYNDN